MKEIESLYRDFIQKRDEHSLNRRLSKTFPVLQTSKITVNGAEYINFSSNDYLGLKDHPALKQRAAEWLEKYGAGSGASRLVTGNIDGFSTIERKVAMLKGTEEALIMVSGYQANASVLPALFDAKILGEKPLVFSDKLNHASMHMGCAAAGISQIRYRHNDMAHLAQLLEKHANDTTPKFILTESIFSMDGDIAPLETIKTLAQKYNCFTIVDEAHATGALGDKGAGLAKDIDVVIGTFSKAMGSFGAYIACSKKVKEYLVNKCSGLIYATALPPAVLGAMNAALDIIPEMDDERLQLKENSDHIRTQLQAMGYDTGASKTQIIPVIIGSNEDTLNLSQAMQDNGLWVSAIRPPTVPQNEARLRIALSTTHTSDDINKLLDVFSSYKIKQTA